MNTNVKNKENVGDDTIRSVTPRYFLVVQEYGDDEFFLNVTSSKFPTYKSANEWLNKETTKMKFPHAYIISVY